MGTFYKHPETITLVASGTISGELLKTFFVQNLADGEPNANAYLILRGLGAEITAFDNGVAAGTFGSSFTPEWSVTCDTGLGDADGDVFTGTTVNAGSPTTTLDVSGTFTISLDVELWQEISTAEDGELFFDYDETGFPVYGGAPVYDPPLYTQSGYYWVARIGGYLQVSANFDNGASVFAETEITSGNQFIVEDYRIYHEVGVQSLANAVGAVSIETEFMGQTLSVPYSRSFSGLYTGVPTIVNANGSSCSVSYQWDTTLETGGAICITNIAPDTSYLINGVLKRWNEAYSGSLKFRIEEKVDTTSDVYFVDGALSHSITQRHYAANSIFFVDVEYGGGQEDPAALAINELFAPRMYGDISALAAAGESSGDWRICWRLERDVFTAGTITQASSQTVDDGTSLTPSTGDFQGTWAAQSNTTLTIDAGALKAVISGGSGGIVKTFGNVGSWKGASFCGYRFLKVRIKADAATKGFRVKVAYPDPDNEGAELTKTWTQSKTGSALETHATPGTYSELVIDLCAPTSATAETDSKDTRYPYRKEELSPRRNYVDDSDYWGVSNALKLTVDDLDDGVIYHIDTIELVRDSWSRLTIHPAYNNWIASAIDEEALSIADYRIHFFLGETDGRYSLEQTDFFRQDGAYSIGAIGALLEAINGNGGAYPTDGWTATPATFAALDPANPIANYLRNDRDAAILYGNGLLRRAGNWEQSIDLSATGTLTLYAQPLYDRIGFPPRFNMDDPTTHAAVTNLYCGKVFRGHSDGLVLNDDFTPKSGGTVSIDGGTSGSGTTDSAGYYRTGTPFAKPSNSRPLTHSDLTINAKYHARKRTRGCFRKQDTTERPYRAIQADSPRQWIHLGQGKKVKTTYLETLSENFVSDEHTPDAWAKFRTDPRGGLWLGLGVTGTTDWRVYGSYDGGLNITEKLALTAKSALIEILSEQGVLLALYTDASDNLYRRYSTDFGATWQSAESVTNDSGGAQLTGTLLDSTYDGRGGGVLFMTLQAVGGTDSKVWKSFDWGKTFAEALS